MLSTLRNAWKIPDLRKKILFTLLMLAFFRFGAAIPVPGIDRQYIADLFTKQAGGVLDFLNLMSGGAFKQFTIFALNIYPYITASIIINLLTIAIPKLEALAKEGEEGKKKMAQYTRYGTIVLALVQATAFGLGFFKNALVEKDPLSIIVVVMTLTAGTAFLMWLGEQITEKGIGNGISLIIFIGIVSRLPVGLYQIVNRVSIGAVNILEILIFVVIALLMIAAVIAIQQGQRKIPVQYAKRVVGRKMYGGQSTHIPIKVLMAGVIPVIFASSLLAFPQTLALFFEGNFGNWVSEFLTLNGAAGKWIYSFLNIILIIFFTYFYTAIQFNPIEYANNLKQYGGFIPGIRPGRPTSEYLNRVVSRITIVGALVLAFIATLPVLMNTFSNLEIGFGGTALLIVVGVALDTVKQVESQMLMRHYKGFLK